MKDTQNFTIVMLLITAAVLTSLWVFTEPTAQASATDRGGDYIMATGGTNNQVDVLYVIDTANAKLNVYYPNINTNQLELAVSTNLATIFK